MEQAKELFNGALRQGWEWPDRMQLARLADDYPWCALLRMLALRESLRANDRKQAGRQQRSAALFFLADNYYNLLRGHTWHEYCERLSLCRKKGEREETADRKKEGRLSLIDRFLNADLSKRKPLPEAGNADLAEIDEESLATEEIAKVYVRVGRFSEAEKIYRKLSLKYPEKSVYFAEIIGDLRVKASERERE